METTADSSMKTAKARGRPFQKGKSGNPGGRPKTTQEQKDALQQIRDLAPRAAEEMQRILDDPRAPQALKLRVAEVVFDRAFGKPRQEVEMKTTALSDEAKAELDKLLEETKGEIR